jgi:hypothetical protein
MNLAYKSEKSKPHIHRLEKLLMKGTSMKSKIKLSILSTAFSLLVCSFLFTENVNAATPALWWGSTEIDTKSVSDCASFGGTVLANSSFNNVKITNWTASGSNGNTSVTIGCIGTSPKVIALIMVTARTIQNVSSQYNIIQSKVAAYPTAPLPPAPPSERKISVPLKTKINPSVIAAKTQAETSVLSGNTIPQSPMYFYWKTFTVRTNTTDKCYQLARPDFKGKTGYKEIKGSELSFSSGTSYVALKCFQTGSLTTAVIAVVGDDNTQTQSLFNTISDRISKRVFID